MSGYAFKKYIYSQLIVAQQLFIVWNAESLDSTMWLWKYAYKYQMIKYDKNKTNTVS